MILTIRTVYILLLQNYFYGQGEHNHIEDAKKKSRFFWRQLGV